MKILEVDNKENNLAKSFVTTAISILNQTKLKTRRVVDANDFNLLPDVEEVLGDLDKNFWNKLDNAVEAGDPKELTLLIMDLREKATKAVISKGNKKSKYYLDKYFRRMIGYYLTVSYWPRDEVEAGFYHAKTNMEKFSKETIRFFKATKQTGANFSNIEPVFKSKSATRAEENEYIEGISKKIVDALFNEYWIGFTEDETAVVNAIKELKTSAEFTLLGDQYSKDTQDQEDSSKDLVTDIYEYLGDSEIDEIAKHLESIGTRLPSKPEGT